MDNGKQYWRSLSQLQGSPEFLEWVHREFQPDATKAPEGASRRTLLKLMSASLGLAGLTACRRPVERILPNAKGVEDYIPGVPVFYSTVMNLGGVGTGLLAKVNDGRPTKLEGNPSHPASLGAANGFHQASILSLYDPDRSKAVRKGGSDSNWDDFASFATGHFGTQMGQGAGLRFLTERSNSPSFQAVKAFTLKKYPQAKWVEYEPVATDEHLAGALMAFGQPVIPQYHLEAADVVVSLDSDFLGLDERSLADHKAFGKKRRVSSEKDEMNRLYVAESQYSVTGAMADHRLRLRAGDVKNLAGELANKLNLVSNGLKVLGQSSGPADKWIASVARDLQKNKGKSLVIAGPRQPAAVHALAALMNQSLGNVGTTVTYLQTGDEGFRPQLESLKELSGEMASGSVKTLVMLGGNPAFTAPADLAFAANLKKVPVSIHVGPEVDETAVLATWHLPQAHYLETWGDGRGPEGTCSVQQPMIQPLFGGKSCAEVLAQLASYPDQRGYDIVRNYWLTKLGKDDAADRQWRQSLNDGVFPNTEYPIATVTANAAKIAPLFTGSAAAKGYEVVFVPSSQVYDGRFANNGWLQEAPDPMTKLTWDNAALISPATARALGIATKDELGDLYRGGMIALERNGRRLEMPVFVIPGQAENSITIAVGHGRREVGRVGKGQGFDAYQLRTTDGFNFVDGVQVTSLGRRYPLATTQDHHSMEGRPLVRETSLEEYKKEPEVFEKMGEEGPLFSLFKEHNFDQPHQWGMTIDLNTCSGCNACVLACQAENNIPIVGKKEVMRGRAMHWIRMDRYFSGSEEAPEVVHQTVLCQQCQNAPCEAVCPVAATVHSPEGLNDMAYNRCVGTRYCSNNCPYKVRRFNFFNWHDGITEVEKMHFNPDVTVRMRGVMEKCNYCVQRIQGAKIQAKAAWRNGTRPSELVQDGEVQTACQQTCPTESIIFGNIADPNSRVSKLKAQNRNYALLGELNNKPRTTYLAKLRNPNPELA